MLLGFLPSPQLTFGNVSVGNVLPFPSTEAVGAAELTAQQSAADEPLGADRVSGTDTSTGEFSSIGVTFDTPPTDPVMVRVKSQSGRWSEWHEFEGDPNEGPDAGTTEADRARAGTEPLWVKDATGYEVSIGSGDVGNDAKVVLVQDEQRRGVAVATPMADAAQRSYNIPFAYGSRTAWGARPPAYSLDVTWNIIHLAVVHHTDLANDYGPGDVPGILRSIQAFHMDGRGWSDIGYNFLVDKWGGIWQGRGDPWERTIGADAAGFNSGSVGISAIGDYTAAGPTGALLQSIGTVAGWKLAMYGQDPYGWSYFTSGGSPKYAAGEVVPLSAIVGHQDVGLTGCPGSLEGYLHHIRQYARTTFDQLRTVGVDNPVGMTEFVVRSGNSIVTNGWAFDPNTNARVSIVVTMDGAWYWNPTWVWRPEDVFPVGFDGIHGFAIQIPASPGAHNVCVYAMNLGSGADTNLYCGVVEVTMDGRAVSPTARPRSR